MPISYVPYVLTVKGESTIYQNEVRCHVNENDFNYSLNPTIFNSASFSSGSYISGSGIGPIFTAQGQTGSYYYLMSGKMIDSVTGSSFTPYATTIGLYNDQDELLVIGKLATPYPIPSHTDVTFVIRYDS